MQDLKVALVQSHQFWEDKEANFENYEAQYLHGLKGQPVDLVLLPEMFNSGFTMNVHEMGESMNGISITWLQKWAKILNTTIGGSLIINEGNDYVNKFVLVDRTGITATYNKRHLFRMAEEHSFFTGGDERTIVELNGWKLCLQVCYDLRFPVYSRKKVVDNEHDYDALIYVANWPAKRSYIWQNLLQARAIENQAYVVGVNRIGEDENAITYNGHSMVINPWGLIDLDMKQDAACAINVLSRAELDKIRTNFPAFLDADTFKLC
jgi:omega-amidase